MNRFNFWSSIGAGFLAAVAMTIVSLIFGVDIMKLLGEAAGMSGVMVYIVGGLIHLIVAIIYALIYALIFEPLFKGLPKFLSGALYSLLPFIIAVTLTGSFLSLIQTLFVADKAAVVTHPYSERYEKYPQDSEELDETLSRPQTEPNYYQDAPYSPPDIKPLQIEHISCAVVDDQCEKAEPKCPRSAPRKEIESGRCPSGGCVREEYDCPTTTPGTKPRSSGCPSCVKQERDCPKKEEPENECGCPHLDCDGYPGKSHPRRDAYGKGQKSEEYFSPQPSQSQSHKRERAGSSYGSGKRPHWLWNLINHLVYGIVLGLCYRPKKRVSSEQGPPNQQQ